MPFLRSSFLFPLLEIDPSFRGETPQSDRSRHIVAEGFRQPLRCGVRIKGY
jgi:hypothetical protein